jgi:hypothetical protein
MVEPCTNFPCIAGVLVIANSALNIDKSAV